MSFLLDLITTLIYYCVLIFSYLGLGWITSQLLSIKFSQPGRPFSLIWLGWAVALLLLQAIHIFVPIVLLWGILLFLIGLISAFTYLRTDAQYVNTLLASHLWLGLIGSTAILIAILCMQTPKAYDSGLYHFNSVRWLNEYPIVLGVGNLHGRLAFNQAFFAFVAHLNLYPVFNQGHHIANGFLIFLLLAEELLYLSQHITKSEQIVNLSANNMLAIFAIPVTVYLALYDDLPAPAPDTASAILQILIFIYFIRAMEGSISGANDDSQMLFVFIMSATIITVKISNLVFVLTICAVLLITRLRHWHVSPGQAIARTTKMLALPFFIIVIWCLRGILLSGCPAYPSTFGCINASWSVPIEAIQNQANWIYSWARVPREVPEKVLSSWDWLKPWFNSVILTNKLSIIYPLIISCLGFIIILGMYLRELLSKTMNKILFLIPIPILTGLIFWFFSAPDPRFVQSLILLLPIAIAVILVNMFEITGKLRNGMLITALLIININTSWAIFEGTQPLTEFPVHGFRPTRMVRLIKNTTSSGLDVFSPKKDDQCWDSELPCTPEFKDELGFDDNIIFPEFRVTVGK